MLSYENRATMGQPNSTTSDHLPVSSTSSSNAMPNGQSTKTAQPDTKHHHIWLVTGPAGCGKSTVAQFMSKAMNLPYIEGDEYHPPANIEKMSTGTPLTDADRWDWLTKLREESLHRINAGSQGVVVTCSALKRKYRDVIRVAPYYDHDVLLHFIYLDAPEEVLVQRVMARKGHYMSANMVRSQYKDLQPPTEDETDVITVDVSGTPEEVEKEALASVHLAMRKELNGAA